jgi:ferritin
MMISTNMNAKLNEQITAEFAAAHKYLAMSCALEAKGLKSLAKRFTAQYEEELKHGNKIVRYLHDVGATVSLDAIPKPAPDCSSLKTIVQAALDGENDITRRIHALVAAAEVEKDYSTLEFLQWYVDEQVEEIATMTQLLKVVELAGPNVLQVEAYMRHEIGES